MFTDQSVEEQSSGWSEVSEQPQSATAVSAEDVEQEKPCSVVQESKGKCKPKREKITRPCAGTAVQHPPFKARQSDVEKEEIGARGLASRRED